MTDTMDLHLGCGRNHLDGWVNLDMYPYPGVDVVADATKRLPFEDNTFTRVFSQDFLEHLPPEFKVPIINEIWRVLKPLGEMEHYVPNAGSRNDFGSPTHISHWSLQQFEHFDIDSYRWTKDKEYEGITCGFKKVFAELVNQDPNGEWQSIHVRYQAIKPSLTNA